MEAFQLSRSTVYNYVSELVRDQIIVKEENGQYSLASDQKFLMYENQNLDEERVFTADIFPFLESLPTNVIEAWRYAFTAMMKNSETEKIYVKVIRDRLQTTIVIMDEGVGIFRKIQEYIQKDRGENLTLVECVSLLFAGKFTTAREYHSGEGIFFTSHLMDDFFIMSDELLFTRNNFSDAYTNMASCEKGTLVYMQLFNKSQKTVKEVFDRYTNPEERFTHTSVPIAHMFTGGSPVSRSEARRLGGMLLRFKKATLDFTGVKGIGQAFTHELFVVWQRRNPEIELNCIGMEEDVERMIRRVLVDAGEKT